MEREALGLELGSHRHANNYARLYKLLLLLFEFMCSCSTELYDLYLQSSP